jgi:flagellar hook-associated protein 3 FlgL
MMMNTYRKNLQGSNLKLSDSMDKVMTKRNFNSYAEDPAAATQAFRLRRDWYQTSSQLDNANSVYSKFNTAWHNMGGIIKDLSDTNGRVSAIRGTNGTAGESRTALAKVLRETGDSIIQAMNQKVGDQFIFAGNDGLNVPFSWGEDPDGNKILLYRGINVNSKNPEDQQRLKEMTQEEINIDLGMGLKEDDNAVLINGSAFNAALCGLDFMNYGVDEDGDPKNLALIMRELADVFDGWRENGQKYMPEKYRDMSADEIKQIMEADGPEAKEINAYHAEMEEKANRLMDKLNAAQEHTTEKYVELDASASFLQSEQGILSSQKTDLNTQILEVEQIDLADAITRMSYDQMCYNAALKIGTQLLSQSLVDYMN